MQRLRPYVFGHPKWIDTPSMPLQAVQGLPHLMVRCGLMPIPLHKPAKRVQHKPAKRAIAWHGL
jgi:hypothetical protein